MDFNLIRRLFSNEFQLYFVPLIFNGDDICESNHFSALKNVLLVNYGRTKVLLITYLGAKTFDYEGGFF